MESYRETDRQLWRNTWIVIERQTDREREMKDKERLTYSYRDTVPVRDTEDIYRETVTERER